MKDVSLYNNCTDLIRFSCLLLFWVLTPLFVSAQCNCEYGVAYEPSQGLCYVINACSDPLSTNYCEADSYFNENCVYESEDVLGCTCVNAYNFNPTATIDDGNCIIIGGCSDTLASNFSDCGSIFYNENCIYGGCTDPFACNYDSIIQEDDGSCEYAQLYYDCDNNCLLDSDGDGVCDENEFSGCADPMALNYFCEFSPACGFDFSTGFPIFILPDGFDDDSSCTYDGVDENQDGIPDNSLQGCEDPGALNYNNNFIVWSSLSYINNLSSYQEIICIYPVFGCTDELSCNFDFNANSSDGSCVYADDFLDCEGNCLYDSDNDGICDELEVFGCTEPVAYNYNILATEDDDSCVIPIYGCTSQEAFNYNPEATENDGSCVQSIIGCSNQNACNFDININTVNDDLCIFPENGFDCNGECLNDTDNDGVCDEFEIVGCTDPSADNFSNNATESDISLCDYSSNCECNFGSVMLVGGLCYIGNACSDSSSNNYCSGDVYFNEYCEYDEVSIGCTCVEAVNYNLNAIEDDGSCVIVGGCNDPLSINFTNCTGTYYNDVCLYNGCTDSLACNYNYEANYDDGSCIYPQNYYSCSGECINDINQNNICDELEGTSVQNIQFEQGWNMFSSNLIIENPNIESVMSPVSSSLLLVKDDSGNVYWPMVGLNQIGNIELGKAYMSKMTFDSSLDFVGSSIEPENIILNLEEGWSFLGYLRDNPMDVLQVIENDFVDISDDIIIMKDGFGNVFWPEYDLNSLQAMYPGQGYLIKLSTDTEFSFLPNDFEYYHLPLLWPDSNNPLDLQTTGGNATMMINLNEDEILLDGNPISDGDKIGVFYEGENKWLCAGFLTWDDNMPPAALTIWGNLEDGFGLNEGDDLKMFIHDSSSANNYSVENIWTEQGYFISGDLGYVNNALYQTISMSTEIYNEGFNARFGLDASHESRFKDSYPFTSSNMVIAIPNNSWDFSPINLSEIIAYDSYGNIVGSSVYDNNSMSLIVWEDDIYTDEKDGMLQGEKFILKYWNKDINKQIDLDIVWELGGDNYVSNGLASISFISLSNQISDNSDSNVDLYPNPCSNQSRLSFNLSYDDFISVKILDLQGREISSLFSGFINKGNTNIEINTSKIKIGTYIISIIGHNFKKNISFTKI